jgi:PAS domain S-box-containing protein
MANAVSGVYFGRSGNTFLRGTSWGRGTVVEHEDGLKVERASSSIESASERAERLANFLTLSYEPMLAWRLDGPIEFWNAGAERLYGFAREEAIGRESHALLQTKFPAGPSELMSQLRTAHQWSGELHHTCKDGREVAVDSRMQLLGDGTVLEVNRDVTDRTQIESALRESEQRLRFLASIVESSDDAIVSKNLDGIITSWNRGAERIFGYGADEAIGRPITIVIPHERHGEEADILARIRRGERIDHFETVRQRKDGSHIVVSITVSPVKNAEGRIVGASKIARDITEQKRTQDMITTLAREAEHRSKNLLANVQATVNLSQADTPEGLKQAIEGRIQALANVHSLFVETRWTGAELLTIASRELAPYAERAEGRVSMSGPQLLLEPNTAQAIAVTLHELATNAAKYGALSAASGRVALNWTHLANGPLKLHWSETGGPAVKPPARSGFGTRIVERMIAQLKGTAIFDWRADGLICEITVEV